MAHQEGCDGSACQEAGQHVRPVVAVLGHADHAHQEGGAQQGQAERGFDQAGALHSEHKRHVHLREPNQSGDTVQFAEPGYGIPGWGRGQNL